MNWREELVKSEVRRLTRSEHKRAWDNYAYSDTDCVSEVGVDTSCVDQRLNRISNLNQVYPSLAEPSISSPEGFPSLSSEVPQSPK